METIKKILSFLFRENKKDKGKKENKENSQKKESNQKKKTESRDEYLLLLKMLPLIQEQIYNTIFYFKNIVNNDALEIRVDLPNNHSYSIKIIVHETKEDAMILKTNSSSLEGYISKQNFHELVDDFIQDLQMQIKARFKGYKNERRAEGLIEFILSQHKVDMALVPRNNAQDMAGVDLALRKSKNKNTNLQDLYFQVKSSDTKSKLYYKGTYINTLIVNQSKSRDELCAEIWNVIRRYCDGYNIKYQ